MNWGRYQCIILHILTHGSRCVVSAWIPVSNYLSASAHWCHSFPVITQSPACQDQVTSRWAWLVLNWALSPILSRSDVTNSHQPGDSTDQPIASLLTQWKLWSASDHWCWTIITGEGVLFWHHFWMCTWCCVSLWAAHYRTYTNNSNSACLYLSITERYLPLTSHKLLSEMLNWEQLLCWQSKCSCLVVNWKTAVWVNKVQLKGS